MSDSADLDALRHEIARLQAVAEGTERRLRATHAVTRALGEDASVVEVMPRTLAALAGALGSKLAAFWQPEGERLVVAATWCSVEAQCETWETLNRAYSFEIGEGIPGRVWRDRGPVWIADLAEEKVLPRRDKLEQLGVRSGVAVPVMSGGTLLGVIELFAAKPEPTDENLLEVLRTIGAHVGQFLRHAQMTSAAQASARELAQEREKLTRLDEVARKIASERESQQLVQVVTDAATELTGAKFGAFFYNVSDAHGDSYLLYTLSGASREAFEKFPIPRKTPLFAPTFEGKGPVRIADVTKDPRYGKTAPHRGMPDGHLPVKSYLAVPVATRSGVVIGGLFLGHPEADVSTDRSQRIASAIAAHAATAMDNARLHADSQRLIGELEKTNVELDQFAYVASHDLRAPLRGISNLALWIEEDLGSALPKKVAEQLQLLKGRAARMDRLINGLLELARIGRSRQKSERVDVTELLHETIDLASPSPKARVLIIGAMPTLTAERVALQQVLLNLIANALQHAGRPDVLVRITAIERADEVEMVIADNGVGIAPAHHVRVWQMFQTLVARDNAETTGIGLAIVKKQVEANGGRAWIDSSAREGATLRFTWPRRGR
ncbi:hypothetical protein BH11MYX3_BH11MYX3_10410 [soil metagenome]